MPLVMCAMCRNEFGDHRQRCPACGTERPKRKDDGTTENDDFTRQLNMVASGVYRSKQR